MPLIDKKTQLFTDHYNAYYTLIFCTVQSHVNNIDLVKDICQEVFIRFYEKFEEVENPKNWLYGTMRLVTLEFLRKNNIDSIDTISSETCLASMDRETDTERFINEAIHAAIAGDEESRILFDLIAVYNFSYKAAAERLGITEHQSRYKYNIIVKKVLLYFKNKGISSLEELL
jgi:RNA polymerase sigma factor (sigma-70 family)